MKRRPACVIGDLNLVRCLRRERIPVALATGRRGCADRLSRHCAAVIALPDPLADPAGALAALLAYARRAGGRPVLYYTGDPDLLFVSRHRAKLAEAFDFLVPPAEVVETLVDKARFHELAAELGLPVPPTAALPPGEAARGLLERWEAFPCLLKPLCRRVGWQGSELLRASGCRGKAIPLADAAQLRALLPSVLRHPRPLLIQAAIPGGEERIVSYHAYLDLRGHCAGEFTGRKLRTYPRAFGHSTCVEISGDRRVRALGRWVVERLGFRGVIKLDFKEHPRTGALFLLEANPRFNLWHHPGAAAGVNLPALVYRDLTGAPVRPPAGPARAGVRWVSFLDDLNAFREYRQAGELTWAAWLRSLLRCRAYEGFAWDDPLPAAVGCARSALRGVRRRLRRTAETGGTADALVDPG